MPMEGQVKFLSPQNILKLLEHSPKQLKQMGTCFNFKKEHWQKLQNGLKQLAQWNPNLCKLIWKDAVNTLNALWSTLYKMLALKLIYCMFEWIWDLGVTFWIIAFALIWAILCFFYILCKV